MFVLNCSLGESIEITGRDVTILVTLSELDRNKLRLMVAAPKKVPIIRMELLGRNYRRPEISGDPDQHGNLKLARKRGEKILINEEIIVCYVEPRGDKIRIDIDAPQEYTIARPQPLSATWRSPPPH